MSKDFDVIVIGGGPAGYVAAIRAAQLGMKTACVDNWLNRDGNQAFGGTCLNAGCIPSKALLESSELYHRAQHEFDKHGIAAGKIKLDLEAMHARKSGICKQMNGGVQALFKSNGVEGIAGTGTVLGSGKVKVTPVDKGDSKELSCEHIIIASGSSPVELKIAPFDGDRIVDSWGALEFSEVPKRLGIIGAGVIGVELGSVWSRLGAEVVLLEAMDQFIPVADQQIAKEAARHFKKQGLDIRLGARVLGAKAQKTQVKVEYQTGDDKHSETFDRLVVAVGRRPNTDDLFSKDSGLALDDKGFVKVDENYRTNLPNVYAVGDVIGGLMLAHKGSEEGVACAELIAGQKPQVNYDTIPSVIYTAPELAWVGKTEEQLKSEGVEYNVGTFPFSANGRSKALEMSVGTVKMIADAKTDRILGVHMVGPYVSELVAEAVVAMEFGATAEDIALTMHAHPTLSEAVHEAALSVHGHAIHAINKKRR
ncbi:dihydrolipoyl dehydrogenase [Abyssibacter profundi]|uniref:Dihydrolipoyl dehydrogenase n=1 Tax=Abyssibacter profundi TaxID=2182787 RepID=A0A363UPX1_9GAMM|nr:dihydrolipoyl dehydrogenase [Abyssibacter profundi]MBV62607.1 dihydrolipoyl dehydrogenase [Nevskiales bacterium]PWN57455.1 dihydrolipoyl dehydrogenase [Abyssibacter profundi]